MDTRKFIEALGGYRQVANRLGKGRTTVHTHMQAGVLPASWYDALCQLAVEKGIDAPPKRFFSFLDMRKASCSELIEKDPQGEAAA